jgi:hypothetical protein
MAKLGKIETEEAWQASVNAKAMLNVFKGKMMSRQRRLFAVALCRQTELYPIDEPWEQILQVGEAYADGKAKKRELEEGRAAAERIRNKRQRVSRTLMADAVASACHALRPDFRCLYCLKEVMKAEGLSYLIKDKRAHCGLVRDIFGNPFATVSFEARSVSATARKLAQSMYDERRFADLPVLADALEEGGCTDAAILAHCRDKGDHVRGCWVIDLVLGLRKTSDVAT